MHRIASLFAALVLSLAAVAAPKAHALEGDTLVFGIISTESSEGLADTWKPFLSEMEKGIGMKVKAFFAPDYAGVIEAMRFKKVDVAWFGNKSAMVAVDRSGAEIFCQTVDVEGNPGYWSLLVVHKDSPHNSIDDLLANAGELTFGNGDPNSTSGFLVPSYYVWGLRGIDPASTFKNVTNANHEANLVSVAQKKVDFATNNTESLRRFQKAQPDKAAQIKVIWKSPLIPNDPFVFHKELPKELKNTLRGWILSFGRIGPNASAEREILAKTSSGFAPFVNSNNHQLLPIRQLALFKDKLKLQADANISDDEKSKQMADIDAQLADLETLARLLADGK